MNTDPQYMKKKKNKKSESGSILNGYGSDIHGKLKNPDLDFY